MEATAKQYVELSEGDYFVTGSRVLLEGLVYEFQDGRSPETIQQSFATLTLAQVYGALTFYLDHQAEINAYLQQRRAEYESRRQANINQQPDFQRLMQEKIAAVRQQELVHLRRFVFQPMRASAMHSFTRSCTRTPR